MLESLITSKTRIKLLMRLFLNPSNFGHLRGLAEEFSESTNAVRVELNRFEEANMLLSENIGNKKVYKANTTHPLFPEVQRILKKVTGIDEVTKKVLKKIGGLEEVYLTGSLAHGKDSQNLELILIGQNINELFLSELILKAESLINRKITTLIIHSPGTEWHLLHKSNALLIWHQDWPLDEN